MSIFDDPPKSSIFDDAPAAPAAPASSDPGWSASRVLGDLGTGVKKVGEGLNSAIDAGTFGANDWLAGHLLALVGGPNTEQLRARTQAGREDLGPVLSTAADMAGYYYGPGKLGMGIKVGKNLLDLTGRAILSRVGGSAAEGGLASGLGTVGHGDTDPTDVAKSTVMGLGTGAITGALPVSREVPQTADTPNLMNTAHDAWTRTYGEKVDPNDVVKMLGQAHLGLDAGEQSLLAPSTASAVGRVMNIANSSSSLNGNNLKKFQDAIMGSTKDPQELRIAGKFRDALDAAYGPQAQPVVAAANKATSRAKTSDELDSLLLNPKGAPAAVTGMLKNDPGLYAHIRSTLEPIAAMANPTLGQDIKSRLVAAGIGAAGGAALSAVAGGNEPAEMTAGAVLGALKGRGTASIRNKPIINSILAAKHQNATGVSLPPSSFSPSGPYATVPSDLLRNYIYSRGATGQF